MSKWALIGIHQETRQVVSIAVCTDDHLQEHWNEMITDDIVPAIIPIDQAKFHFCEKITPEALVQHLFPEFAKGDKDA